MNAHELDAKFNEMSELKRLREEFDAELESIESEIKRIRNELVKQA